MTKQEQDPMNALIAVMKKLRDPETGCPWDQVQDFESIAPYTIEEAYEVADTIRTGDMAGLREELGDLLLQVVYHAQIAGEKFLFDFNDVARDITDKMIARHPHVFGDSTAQTPDDVNLLWEAQKDQEKRKNGKIKESILDDVPLALPAIMRAQKLQKRAARAGFEWEKAEDVLTKLEEEIAEIRTAIANKNQDEIQEELGDMLFCVVNFGRMLDVDCEQALRNTNDKFERRFKGIERELKAINKPIEEATLDEMEALWVQEKRREKTA